MLLHATAALPQGGARDFVLRAAWALSEGAHACTLRPVLSDAAPEVAGVHRSAVAADVYVLANPQEAGGTVLHAVLDAGDSTPLMSDGVGAKHLLEWTRRVVEGAALLQRESVGGGGGAS